MSMIQRCVEAIGEPICEIVFPLIEDQPMGTICEQAALGMGSVAIGVLALIGGGLTVRALSSRSVVQISEPSPSRVHKVREFLESHDINFQDPISGDTILMAACKDGSLEAVLELLGNLPLIDLANNQGDTALHFACRKGNLKIAEELTKRGASTDVANQAGETPLQVTDKKNKEIRDLLALNGVRKT